MRVFERTNWLNHRIRSTRFKGTRYKSLFCYRETDTVEGQFRHKLGDIPNEVHIGGTDVYGPKQATDVYKYRLFFERRH